mmetsp:Transcript_58837/g.156631  ORF Transcript_58837/g.156631 Transcript_58837/m.156631 type:complete len:245 (-) Transcript_58837:625-1359(-)
MESISQGYSQFREWSSTSFLQGAVKETLTAIERPQYHLAHFIGRGQAHNQVRPWRNIIIPHAVNVLPVDFRLLPQLECLLNHFLASSLALSFLLLSSCVEQLFLLDKRQLHATHSALLPVFQESPLTFQLFRGKPVGVVLLSSDVGYIRLVPSLGLFFDSPTFVQLLSCIELIAPPPFVIVTLELSQASFQRVHPSLIVGLLLIPLTTQGLHPCRTPPFTSLKFGIQLVAVVSRLFHVGCRAFL